MPRSSSKQGLAYALLVAGVVSFSVGVGLVFGAATGLAIFGALIGVIGMFLVDVS